MKDDDDDDEVGVVVEVGTRVAEVVVVETNEAVVVVD